MSNKSNIWNNQPVLRFSLACGENEGWDRILRELHLYAREQHFRHVSPIIEVSGDDCKVRSNDDPLAALKLEARGIAMANNRLLTFDPVEFKAFVGQLPNKRLMIVGFAQYPETVQSESGYNHTTPWHGKRIWHGTVSTKDARFISKPDDCRESHRVATNLLRFADEHEVVRIVEDMTGFFSTRNERDLDVLRCHPTAMEHLQS